MSKPSMFWVVFMSWLGGGDAFSVSTLLREGNTGHAMVFAALAAAAALVVRAELLKAAQS